MNYRTIAEASQQYGVADKTIRRLIAKLSPTDQKKYTRKKANRIYIAESLLASKFGTPETTKQSTPETGQADTAILSLLKQSLETLQSQLAEKDKQIERLDGKLDQQQKLQLNLQSQLESLQNQLAIEAPKPAKAAKAKATANNNPHRAPQKRATTKKRPNPQVKTETPASEPVRQKKSLFERMFGA